jgi:hypothetical protein
VGQNWPKVFVFIPSRTYLIPVLQSVEYLTHHALHAFLYRVVDEISQYHGLGSYEM